MLLGWCMVPHVADHGRGTAVQVLVKESEGPVEHLVKVGTRAKVLEELRVASKPARAKGKPGRRKQKVAVENLDEEAAEPEEHAGENQR